MRCSSSSSAFGATGEVWDPPEKWLLLWSNIAETTPPPHQPITFTAPIWLSFVKLLRKNLYREKDTPKDPQNSFTQCSV